MRRPPPPSLGTPARPRHLARPRTTQPWPVLLALCLTLVRAHTSENPTPAAAEASLAGRLHQFLADPRFQPSTWGVRIDSLTRGTTLFATNEQRLLQPASNAKLFTAALALDALGPGFRIRTTLLSPHKPNPHGVLTGPLIIRGQGDFSFAARFHEGRAELALEPLVRAVRHAGITRIDGGLIGDATFFAGPPWGHGWTWDDLQHDYGAAVSALTVEDNALDLVLRPGAQPGTPCRIQLHPSTDYLHLVNRTRTVEHDGPRDIRLLRLPGDTNVFLEGTLPLRSEAWTEAVSVPQPARWFLHLLRQRLQENHIAVRGPLQAHEWPQPRPHPTAIALAESESPPLRDLVHIMMKTSQNQYAQLLLLQVGARQPRPAPHAQPTTESQGLQALHHFLNRLGIPADQVRLDDGSGLSRSSRVTPAAVVELLRAMHRHSHGRIFRDGLPIAGVDGSLANRFEDTPAAGRIRAKTGSFSGVHTLSGYADAANGETLAFSILLNGSHAGAATRADLDRFAALLVTPE